MDKLIFQGGAVKALGNGQVEGYLVLFGDPNQTDASNLRDYFTPETDFGLSDGMKSAIWYRHALEPALDRQIGEGSLKTDDVGVFISGQLNLRDRYVKAVYEKMAVKGKLGWSSGSANHLIRREPQENGSHKVIRWPLGLDASLTPDPAEPRTEALAVKSLTDLPSTPPLEELLPEIKAVYLGEHIERDMTIAALERLNGALMYSVVYRCLYDEELTSEQKRERISGAFAEFSSIALDTLSPYLTRGTETDGAMKTIRNLWGPARPESLADHTAKVVSAAADLAERLESRLEVRRTDGRSLSPSNRDALKSVLVALEEVDAVKAHLSRLLAAAEPGATTVPDALMCERERLRLLVQTSIAACGAA